MFSPDYEFALTPERFAEIYWINPKKWRIDGGCCNLIYNHPTKGEMKIAIPCKYRKDYQELFAKFSIQNFEAHNDEQIRIVLEDVQKDIDKQEENRGQQHPHNHVHDHNHDHDRSHIHHHHNPNS